MSTFLCNAMVVVREEWPVLLSALPKIDALAEMSGEVRLNGPIGADGAAEKGGARSCATMASMTRSIAAVPRFSIPHRAKVHDVNTRPAKLMVDHHPSQ